MREPADRPLLPSDTMASATGASKGAASSSPVDILAIGCHSPACDFKPLRLQRRPVGEHDVLFDLKYCGVCHTDLHGAAGHLRTLYGSKVMDRCYEQGFVPGHELAGVVVEVGSKVSNVAVGDHIGVGCMTDSCLKCDACLRGEEQKCLKNVGTYGAVDQHGRAQTYPLGRPVIGGYSSKMVIHERFGIRVPREYSLAAAGPIMCSGVTLYDPLRRYGAKPGSRVAIVGIGGLGTIGVKLAKAMGCTVTAITRSPGKAQYARERAGADAVLISTDAAAMRAAKGSFDLVLNTIPSEHDYTVYTALVAKGGKHIVLGLNTGLIAGMVAEGVFGSSSRLTGSGIGGIEATQAVIDLCAKHNILPEIVVKPVEDINRIFEKLNAANDTGERYVLDIAGSLDEGAFERMKNVAPTKLGHPEPGLTLGKIVCGICGMLCCCRWR